MVCRRLQFGQASDYLVEPITRFNVREAHRHIDDQMRADCRYKNLKVIQFKKSNSNGQAIFLE